ncbi:hypothetical protein [Streptococcus pasteurianus]|uniref:hypothetical protein n=1 Tax=Streptococcus pasteurianus TaxID=197614 RepID=UPI000B243A9A|nr:hypothetical protein [Streptococcus pasteurianus]
MFLETFVTFLGYAILSKSITKHRPCRLGMASICFGVANSCIRLYGCHAFVLFGYGQFQNCHD